jgi:hypothetical protein
MRGDSPARPVRIHYSNVTILLTSRAESYCAEPFRTGLTNPIGSA